jgi:hypothetical protein
MSLRIIKDNIYSRNFQVVTNQSNKVFLENLKRTHGEEDEGVKKVEKVIAGGCRGMFTADVGDYIYIYLEKFSGTIEELGILHHELNHFVDYALDHVGIKGDLRNTEVRAYYYSYIYVKILRNIRAQFKTNKKPQVKAKGEKAKSNDKGKKNRKRSGDISKT